MSNRYTHGHETSVLRSHAWRTAQNSAAYLLPHLSPDAALLDIGAGPGTITVDLASRVRAVTATEIDEGALDLSRRTARQSGADNLTFAVADVHALQFADDSFDVVHAHQVLQHVADPVAALREMARVTRPGGIVAVRDADYAAFTWWPAAPALDRWLELYSQAARANGGEPDAGRRLVAWAHAAGLHDLDASSSTWCYSTPVERQWWGGLWADRTTGTALGRQLADSGFATPDELANVAAAWRAWADHDDGWFSVLHGEILWHKPA
ncbi:class I SAM-dependent methyltransferase [Calidifontibacter terrae]